MALEDGTHTFGPNNGSLKVKTTRQGAAQKVGHDLIIEVASWEGSLVVAGGEASSVTLKADSTTLKVLEGTGGLKALSDGDKSNIGESIDKDVLKKGAISFESSSVSTNGDSVSVQGNLSLVGKTNPVSFTLSSAGGRLTGSATVTQSNWGIKPYKAFLGALKVSDDVVIEIDAAL